MNILTKTGLLLAMSFVNFVYAGIPIKNFSAEQSSRIVENVKVQSTDTFDNFLKQILSSSVLNEKGLIEQSTASKNPLSLTIKKYRGKETLTSSEHHVMQRLLGLYSRLKYGEEAIKTLAQLVAIPTFNVSGLAQHDNPHFKKMATVIAKIAQDFNLEFRNIDNRVYEVSLNGSSKEVVGIHAHADVVPVTPALWVLEDGTKLDPFHLTRIGDRMYGRGTEDDKNGIVVTLYAMRVIQEENIPLLRNIHLLIDTTEETSSQAIPYYFARNPTPNYNLALDGNYPVVIAEKGSGSVMANFTVRPGETNTHATAEIVTITGGLAMNQIPSASVATITSSNPKALALKLNQLAANFVAANGGNFSIYAVLDSQGQTQGQSQGVTLTVKGVSAHSSEPESGVNPVSRMFAFIEFVQHKNAIFKFNHITDAATYIVANWGLNSLGKTLDIDYSHEFMGPLTNAVTFIALDDKNLQVGVNLRLPVGREVDAIKQDISSKLSAWQKNSAIAVDFKIGMREPMYRNPKGQWVNALVDVATENLSMPREFGSSSGGTSVHNLPNGVQFGLAMPHEKYTGHNANEFKRVEQFLLDMQIITEMIARVGQLPSLE
ncbi:dipeptidase [Paraglaciecola sp. 20A4]|uniref:dipeptidase n=1 Tax=Paraglaciecola sp. 20A4 TaxID=2687288 RepID=UPI00197E60FA|nr:dipeptidase [Paraglaciecola sp. 20A4]